MILKLAAFFSATPITNWRASVFARGVGKYPELMQLGSESAQHTGVAAMSSGGKGNMANWAGMNGPRNQQVKQMCVFKLSSTNLELRQHNN